MITKESKRKKSSCKLWLGVSDAPVFANVMARNVEIITQIFCFVFLPIFIRDILITEKDVYFKENIAYMSTIFSSFSVQSCNDAI